MMRPAGTVLVIGYNAWDTVLPWSGFPVPDSKNEVPGLVESGGGPGATAAIAMARLGATVRLVTPLADDPAGLAQRRELEGAGVDLSACPVIEGGCSPRAVILVAPETGERTIFWSRGDLPEIDPQTLSSGMLSGVDLLYTDGHEVSAAIAMARRAREREIPVVMDAGSVRPDSATLVALCTEVISSAKFAPTLVGTDDFREALKSLRAMGPARVAITRGIDGVLALDADDRFIEVSAFDVPTVDTTGAGDAFHAGYAWARLLGRDFHGCLEYGAAVAALKCGDWGGRRGLPTAGQVDELLSTGRRRSGE